MNSLPPPEIFAQDYLWPAILGTSCSTFLFAVGTVQTHLYFKQSKQDPLALKILIGVLWLFQLSHELSCHIFIYISGVQNFGSPGVLATDPKLAICAGLMLLISACISAIVQGFSAYRLGKVIKGWLMPSLIWVLVVVRIVTSVLPAALEFRTGSFSATLSGYRWLLLATWLSGAVSDILVSWNLCWVLYKRRNGFQATIRLVDKLIAWFFATGLVNSCLDILASVLFITSGRKGLKWAAVLVVNPRLLVISMLATLNGRASIRRGRVQTFEHFDKRIFANSRSNFRHPSVISERGITDFQEGISVHVDVDTTRDKMSAL